MSKIKKIYNYATVFKGNPNTVSKIKERIQKVLKVEDKRVPELLSIVKQMKGHTTQLRQITSVLCEKSENEEEAAHKNIVQVNNKINFMEEKDKKIMESSEENKDIAVTHSRESNGIVKEEKVKSKAVESEQHDRITEAHSKNCAKRSI